jgi:hypothetical protein
MVTMTPMASLVPFSPLVIGLDCHQQITSVTVVANGTIGAIFCHGLPLSLLTSTGQMQ